MKDIINIVTALLPQGPMDALGVGVIDFKSATFQIFEATNFEDGLKLTTDPVLYYDLASLTKPLTNSLSFFLRPEAFDEKMKLCLNHRGGLPAWGLLAKDSWKQQILSYPINESETLYSDFSALRVMLELERKKVNQKELCQGVWDAETKFWTELLPWQPTPQYGERKGIPNFGEVHDPNAWVIGEFCSHAGLFSTVGGLCRTLINYQQKTDFINKVKSDLATHSHRFSYGWDRVINPNDTLAGNGCGLSTFGHLGFTGTSIWIDPDKLKGHLVLSNTTKFHWYNKANLNDIRRAIGELVWKS